MAAISSVSKMRIMTKEKGEMTGSLVCCEGGEITETRETGCAEGTTVIVEELFYNVPARRKFLKKDYSEGMAVASMVEKIAMSEPDIAIKFISDGITKFSTTGNGKLSDVVYRIYGKDFTKKLIPVLNETENIIVSGYISNPDFVRANRNFQNFYINGRYFKSKTVIAAFEQAYDSYIPSDKFPSCVLFINIHPSFVDVNVHPSKLEVKFSNEQAVFDSVYCAIRNTLSEKLLRPELDLKEDPLKLTADYLKIAEPFLEIKDTKREPAEKADVKNIYTEKAPELIKRETEAKIDDKSYFKAAFEPEIEKISLVGLDEDKDGFRVSIPGISSPNAYETLFDTVNANTKKTDLSPKNEDPDEDIKADTTNEEKEIPEYKIIGEAFDSYVFLELKDKLIVIDKHAAHERIIFEDMKKNLKKSKTYGQVLLVPTVVKLSGEEYASASEFRKDIEKIGFAYFLNEAERSAEISEIPYGMDPEIASTVFTDISEKLSSAMGSAVLERDILFEKALYQASCKAAIKAGIQYDKEHIKWICDKLLILPNIKFCPHGRPVAFEMSRGDLEHKFKRT
ncbi:MAG: hypothetical protein E7623_08280 [Ruminococcaceae bacterium]|nr:hypothetical protein [Oscillospiraceae bacterium]